MNVDVFAHHWAGLRASFQTWWTRLSDDDLDHIDGRLDRMLSVLEERYSYSRERIARELFERISKHERQQRHARANRQVQEIWTSGWRELRGQARGWWQVLSEDDLDSVGGESEKVIRLLEIAYGLTREVAEAEFNSRVAGCMSARLQHRLFSPD